MTSVVLRFGFASAERMAETPGAWLSARIARSGESMAAASPLTTETIGSIEAVDRVFFVRLAPHSALLTAGIQAVDIETTEIKVGVVTGDMAPAVAVAETDPISKSDVPLEDVTIAPCKWPVLVTESIEALDDGRPIRHAAVEAKALQAISVGFDAGGFSGAAESLHPGLAHTNGVGEVKVDKEDVAYDWAADAAGAVLSAAGNPTRLFLSPYTVKELLKLKDKEERYRLADLQSAASALMGVPVTVTLGCPNGEAFMCDPSTLVIVRRREVVTEVFRSYDIEHAAAAIRLMARMQLVVVDPRGTVHITGLPTPEP